LKKENHLKELKTIKKDLKGLFESQPLAVLATQSDGQPYTSLVAFSSSKDFKELYFATTRATRKYANLMANPRTALLMDNRSNKPSDFRWAMAVTALGRAQELNGDKAKRVAKLYLAKHPHLEEFLTSPTCALVGVEVRTYYLVTRFQDVIEVQVTP